MSRIAKFFMMHRLAVAFVSSTLFVVVSYFLIGGGNVYSFHRYCPMAPVCTAYTMPEQGIVYIFGFGFFISLLVAALFTRRLFCSTLCPIGFLQDIVAIPALKKKLKKRIIPTHLSRKTSFISRTVILLGTFFLPLLIGIISFRYLCPTILFGDVYYGVTTLVSGLTIIVFLLFSTLIPRFFCRFICPLGLILGVIGKAGAKIFPTYTVNISCSTKFGCKACSAVCPTGIDIKTLQGDIDDIDCIQCLACVQKCPIPLKKRGL